MGLGPQGPPIPPPCVLSVVTYPERRSPPGETQGQLQGCFSFLVPLTPEEIAEEKREAELELELQAAMMKVTG